MIRQIPGYYFDEAKQKFFKIQPNHAVPSGSAYSSDGVKRRRVEDDLAHAAARAKERRKNHIRRSRMLADPLLGGSLRQELGQVVFPNSRQEACCQEWHSSVILHSETQNMNQGAGHPLLQDRAPMPSTYNSMPLQEPGAVQRINCSTVAMGGFDFDEHSSSLFAPFKGRTLVQWMIRDDISIHCNSKYDDSMQGFVEESGCNLAPFVRGDGATISANQTPITSININQESKLLMTTWQSPFHGHNVFLSGICDLPDPYITEDLFPGGPPIAYRVSGDSGLPLSIWAAAPGKPHSPFSFALASDDGVYSIGHDGFSNKFIRPPMAKEAGSRSVLAVECLSHFPSVILSGARNGTVNILDIRVPENHYQSGHEGIVHPSAVMHIKQINNNLITVAGLESTLCNYDLRFTPKRPLSHSWPQFCHRPNANIKFTTDPQFTLPILTYPLHENAAHLDLGFDIDAEAGIAAAVQHDVVNTVKIFSLKTGGLLRTLDATAVGGSIDTAGVRAVRFVAESGETEMKSLWVAKGTKIIRYAW